MQKLLTYDMATLREGVWACLDDCVLRGDKESFEALGQLIVALLLGPNRMNYPYADSQNFHTLLGRRMEKLLRDTIQEMDYQ
jgi:hypothetical protein